MQYPLISDYKTAVLIPETFDKFQHLKPVTDSFGQPVFAAGGPAVVFKMYDPSTNKKFALKCFLKHQNNRKEHFDAVGNYLEQIHSRYLCNYEYVEDEIWINESTFPVLVMDWIEGEMMSLHVAELCKKGDHEALSLLASKFDALGLWLMQSDLAHCDIKPDNILVTPQGDLKLVDYDGMYVPELKGKRSPELGTAEYRHPKRTPEDFGPQLDDFPILVLSLSLHSLAKDPSLYDSTINGDALMFRREDYTSLLTCRHLPFFIANQSNEIIGSRFSLLQFSLYQTIIDLKELPKVLEKTAYIPKPLSTKVEPEDGEWIDWYGVKYSADRRKLIKCDSSYEGEYIVREGTEVICDDAFWGCSSLTSLELPSGVTSIGEYAFNGCLSLTSLSLPSGVTSIGEYAFNGCLSLTSLSLPSGVTNIGIGAFSDCSGLTSLSLPSGVMSIGYFAFGGCGSLTSLVLPSGVTSIGNSAFSGCSSLTSLSLPSSVMSIGDDAFNACHSLTSLTFLSGATSIGKYTFRGCSSLTSLTFLSEATNIGGGAFSECSSLRTIVVHGDRFSFEDGALYDLVDKRIICLLPSFNKKDFILRSDITSIGNYAFEDCSSLTSLVLPSGVTSIGEYAFEDCSSLTSLVLPSSVTSIGNYAFYDCSSLTSLVLPSSVTSIGKSAFSGCSSLTSLTLPSDVTSIGESAFAGCNSLISLTLHSSVTNIGKFAFSGCSSLWSLELPSGLTSIGGGAFADCSSLRSLELPSGLTNIEDGAFGGCCSLTSILVNGDHFRFEDGALYDLLGKRIICLLPSFNKKVFILRSDITSIGEYAFNGCSSLRSLELPSGLTSIGKYAFSGCSSLTSLSLPSGVTSIGFRAFGWFSSLKQVVIPKGANKLRALLIERDINESIIIEE